MAREKVFAPRPDPDDPFLNPPRPVRVRRGWWRENRVAVQIGLIVAVAAMIAAYVGSSVVEERRAKREMVSRMGPEMVIYKLPDMSFDIAGGRGVDMSLRLQVRPNVDPLNPRPNAARIADRILDKMAGVEATEIDGAEGAQRVREAVEEAVKREYGADRVKGVLFDRLLIR